MTAFLDLFSGIGGFALGAYWAGLRFDKHYFSEIDDYAVQVYQKRFPEAEPLGDIRNVDYAKLPKGEYLVTGGFPCQPHSVAGKKQGAGDEHDLWPECARVLRELRPAVALFENVPGLFVSNRGEFFNRVLSDISESGYDAEWQIISAQDAGAPHKRERVWIVAYRESGKQQEFAQCDNRKEYGRQAQVGHGAGTGDRGYERNTAEGIRIDRGIAAAFSTNVSNTESELRERRGNTRPGRNGLANSSEVMAHAENERNVRRHGSLGAIEKIGGHRGRQANEWWAVEPGVGRIINGLSEGIHGGLDDKGCGKEGLPENGKNGEMRTLRDCGETGTASPGHRKTANESYRPIPEMPQESRSGLGESAEKEKCYLCYMREGIYPVRFASPQNLQHRLSETNRPVKCVKEAEWGEKWEESINRTAVGVKHRVDRIKCCGNAIVPQCAEMIFYLPAFDRWRKEKLEEEL